MTDPAHSKYSAKAEAELKRVTHDACEIALWLAHQDGKTGHAFAYETGISGAYVFASRDSAKARRIIAAMMAAFNEEYP